MLFRSDICSWGALCTDLPGSLALAFVAVLYFVPFKINFTIVVVGDDRVV